MKALSTIITVGLLLFQLNAINAQSVKVKAFKMTVKGISSLHDWESVVEKIDCRGLLTMSEDAIEIKDMIIKIPVTGIKSTKGKMMDNKTYDAFKHEKYPFIIFTLSSKRVNESNATIDVKGNISMAGITKAITLTVNCKILSNGELQVTGSKKLIMTEFQMEPPTAMMGTIKVGDEVVVSFDLTLSTNSPIL